MKIDSWHSGKKRSVLTTASLQRDSIEWGVCLKLFVSALNHLLIVGDMGLQCGIHTHFTGKKTRLL